MELLTSAQPSVEVKALRLATTLIGKWSRRRRRRRKIRLSVYVCHNADLVNG